MKKYRLLPALITLVILSLSTSSCGQSKRSLKKFNQARQYVAEEQYEKALSRLRDVLAKEPDYTQAHLMAADIYQKQGLLDSALAHYQGLRKYEAPYYLDLFQGRLLFNMQRYSEAKEFLAAYRANPRANSRYIEEVERLIESCDFAVKAQEEIIPYKPQNLGAKVNTEHMEYFPSIAADGLTLVFTHRKLSGDKQDEDFWYTRRDSVGAPWQQAEALRGQLNTPGNEGAQTITADGKVIFFAACERAKGFGSCDIYASFLQPNGNWGKAINLGSNINTARWESQPSISPDGRTLYFVRGGSSKDPNINIMYSSLSTNGWSEARPIPGEVNTRAQEVSPFIHFDNEHLYFSSNGHPGFGDLDFFVSKRQPDGSWGEPQNLGSPINTPAQEFSLIVAPDGQTGYFSSDALEEGFGNLDLYQFNLPPKRRARPIAYIQGKVLDRKTGKALSVRIDFEDIDDSTKTLAQGSNDEGLFYAVLPARSDYALSIAHPGYLFYSRNFSLKEQNRENALELLVELEPIEVGSKVKLENVFFDYDSYQLQERSFAELRQLQLFLERNPGTKIELGGHTDNQGSASYNRDLSNKRAQAVYDFLREAGIAPERMSYKGYGQTKPVADNSTEAGRALNRRTELIVTAYEKQ